MTSNVVDGMEVLREGIRTLDGVARALRFGFEEIADNEAPGECHIGLVRDLLADLDRISSLLVEAESCAASLASRWGGA